MGTLGKQVERKLANDPVLEGQVRGFIAGALGSAGDVASSFTSPASLLMWAAGVGEANAAKKGLTAVAAALKAIRVGGSGVFAASGAQQTVEGIKERDPEKTLLGIGTAAGGAAGVGLEPFGGRAAPEQPPTAIPKLRPVAEPAPRPLRRVAPVAQVQPLSTPMGQRRIGELPEGQAGAPEAPSASVFARRQAPGQRILSTLPEGASGPPAEAPGPSRAPAQPFGLRSRLPGEPVTEVQGPTGPKPLVNRTPAPAQRLLPELPETERAKIDADRSTRQAAKAAAKVPKAPIRVPAQKPLPVIEASAVSQIPASWMPHFENLLADARTQGFTGTREDLGAMFMDRLDRAVEWSEDLEGTKSTEGTDEDLLRLISESGGFSLGRETAMRGELESLAGETAKLQQRGTATRLRKGRGRFLPNLVRPGQAGRSVDMIFEAVKEEPQFANRWKGIEDFLEDVRQAAQRVVERRNTRRGASSFDVAGVMENALGVRPGSRWWDQGGAVEDLTSPERLSRAMQDKLDELEVPRSYQATRQEDLANTITLIRQTPLSADWTVQDTLDAVNEFAKLEAESYHAQENMPALRAGAVDTLSTGEQQPRLPGEAGAVRDVEVPDQPFDLPAKKLEMRGKLDQRTGVQEDLIPGMPGDRGELFGGIGAVELPPKVRDFVEGVRDKVVAAAAPIRMTFALTKFNADTIRTADALDMMRADVAMQEDIRRASAVKVFKWWQSLPTEKQDAYTSAYERTGQFPTPIDPDGSYAKAYHESTDLAHGWAGEGFKNDHAGYIEHYVRHAFEIDPKDVEAASKILQNGSVRAMSANRSVLRHRLFRMPVDEALKAMADKGIKAKLVEHNPELLRQWVVNNAYRALRFRELGDYLKDQGLVKAVHVGEDPPAGYKQLDQKQYGIYFKGEQGLVYAGNYWASEPVKRLLQRAVSVGFQNPWFTGLRETNLIWNQMNLGFSAFHATETAINALASEVARAVQAAGHGELKQAGKSLALSATVIGPGIRDLVNGRAFLDGVLNGDPAAMNVLNEVLKPAGARLLLEKRYLTDHYDKFKQAWTDNDVVRIAGHGLAAIPEKLSWVLMNYTIPAIKLGALLDLTTDIRRRMPNAPFAERQRAYRLAADAMDDRFGLLTHDNLNWSRKVSDIAQFSIRSVGWSFGTVRSFGGSAIDAGKGIAGLLQGDMTAAKANLLSDRVAFTLGLTAAMAYVGMWYQYLHTGKLPDTSSKQALGRDLFHPQDGGVDANGDPTRATVKSYISDLENYYRDPKQTVFHKTSPELEALIAATPWVGTNQNFFGDLIRNPDDPLSQQAYQTGAFLWESFSPFAYQQAKGAYKAGTPVLESVERGAGVQKAPAWVVQTPLEKAILKISRGKLGERHRTPEQVDVDHQKQDLALQYKAITGTDKAARFARAKILSQIPHPDTPTLSNEALLAFIRRVKAPIFETWSTLPWRDRVTLAQQFPAEVQRRFPDDWKKIQDERKKLQTSRR